MEQQRNENFDEVLLQYEPMISAVIRKLSIYRDFENFRQTGRFALYQAWLRFDGTKGHFTPFAYRSIHGAMLDEMKRENRFSDVNTSVENETIELLAPPEIFDPHSDLHDAIIALPQEDRALLIKLYVENRSQAECAADFGISVPGIKKRRARLLKKLREALAAPEV